MPAAERSRSEKAERIPSAVERVPPDRARELGGGSQKGVGRVREG